MTPRKWTREAIIAALQEAHANGVRMNSTSILRHGGGALHRAAQRTFGSVEAAVKAAGLKYERQPARWYPRKPKVVDFEPLPEPEPVVILPVIEEFKAKYQAGKRPKCGYF